MATVKRREAREEIFRLLFETEFHSDAEPQEIYELARETRELTDDRYVRKTYFGICEKREEIDAMISRHANGWRIDRLSPISRNILRLCVFEMKWGQDVPVVVALNEAIELDKRFDDPKAKAFVNGVLNGVKDELASADGAAETGADAEPEIAETEPNVATEIGQTDAIDGKDA